MRLVRDERFGYEGYHGRPAECWLRLYHEIYQRPVAIATELSDNPGTSITNRAAELASVVAVLAIREHGDAGSSLIWIEHYPGDPNAPVDTVHGEHYSRVEFEYSNSKGAFVDPKWSPITKAAVEDLVGQRLSTEHQR